MTSRSKTIIAASLIALAAIAINCWRTDTGAAAANNDQPAVSSSGSRLWVLRLHPGDDLVDSIMEFARKHSINAGGIVTCVGSLDHARLRYANQNDYENLDAKGQHFEIVSLVGTFSTTDRHLHLALANEQGAVFGGHASSGNKVYTTAEIIIVEGARLDVSARERSSHHVSRIVARSTQEPNRR